MGGGEFKMQISLKYFCGYRNRFDEEIVGYNWLAGFRGVYYGGGGVKW